MSGAGGYFSPDYATARERFLAAAQSAGARLHTLALDARGPDGSPLSIDIAWLGAPAPSRVFLHSSGMHGVEGFAGSAIQLALLERGLPVPAECAVLLVHVLNPYGMAWLRRVNENNVDLNRNFPEAEGDPPAASARYRRLDAFLNPPTPPGADLFFLRAVWLALRFGFRPLQQAIVEGQYEFPRGLFFGGRELQPGPSQYLAFLGTHLRSVKRGFAIDVHTGLGKWGQELLFLRAGARDATALGAKLGKTLTPDPEADVGYNIRGGYANALRAIGGNPALNLITQEFGTYSAIRVLHALREENRWHHWGAGGIAHSSKARLKEMFCPESREWRESVVERGVSLAVAAMRYVFG
ncbi:MAG: DUF2817 domain-containing protein [Betaproteobacteria bacterium]|nr:DUF2817 domain-containing protein [Betaproteobacteria bacterium]